MAVENSRRGTWYVLLAAVLWGTTGTAQAVAPPGAQPLTIGFVRIALGTVALIIIAARQGHLNDLKYWRSWPIKTTLVASFAIAAYQLFFFAGVARTGVAVGTIVGIGSAPIAAGIMTALIYHTVPEKRWLLSTVLGLVGCALLILSGGEAVANGLGILLATAAGASYALYTLASKALLAVQPRGAVLAATFFFGTVLLIPIAAAGDYSWLLEPRGAIVALELGIVTVGVAYQLYAMGLSLNSVNSTATLTLAEPLTAGLLGIFLLGEELSIADAAGIALILVGLVLLVRQPRTYRLPVNDETPA